MSRKIASTLFCASVVLLAVMLSAKAEAAVGDNVWVSAENMPPRNLLTSSADRHLLKFPGAHMFIASRDFQGNHYIDRQHSGSLRLDGGYKLRPDLEFEFTVDPRTNWLIVDYADGGLQFIDWGGAVVYEAGFTQQHGNMVRPQSDGDSIYFFRGAFIRAFDPATKEWSESIAPSDLRCTDGSRRPIVDAAIDQLSGMLYLVYTSSDCASQQPDYVLQFYDPQRRSVVHSIPLGRDYLWMQNDTTQTFIRHAGNPNEVTYAELGGGAVLQQARFPAESVPPTFGIGLTQNGLLLELTRDKRELIITDANFQAGHGQIRKPFTINDPEAIIVNVTAQFNKLLVIARGGITALNLDGYLARPLDWPIKAEQGDCIIPSTGPWPPCATGGNPPPPTDDCVIPSSGPWPPCATGGNPPPPADDCVIPSSGPWPPCATGGNPPPPTDDCVIPPSGPWPACARKVSFIVP